MVWKTPSNVLPQEDLSKIFDRFYRLESPRVQMIRGTGLRLGIGKGQVIKIIAGKCGSNPHTCGITIGFMLPTPEAPPTINLERPEE